MLLVVAVDFTHTKLIVGPASLEFSNVRRSD
jgi:hypothetical protein